MVSGMRSPFSCRRRMTNWPGCCLRAMRGASIDKLLDVQPDRPGIDDLKHACLPEITAYFEGNTIGFGRM